MPEEEPDEREGDAHGAEYRGPPSIEVRATRKCRRPRRHEVVGNTVVFVTYAGTEVKLDGAGQEILDAEECSG